MAGFGSRRPRASISRQGASHFTASHPVLYPKGTGPSGASSKGAKVVSGPLDHAVQAVACWPSSYFFSDVSRPHFTSQRHISASSTARIRSTSSSSVLIVSPSAVSLPLRNTGQRPRGRRGPPVPSDPPTQTPADHFRPPPRYTPSCAIPHG